VLIQLPDPSTLGGSGTAPPVAPAQIAATVVDVAEVRDDGSQVIDVTVGTGDFANVAALANAGRIAVALVAGG